MVGDERAAGNKKTYTEKDIVFQEVLLQTLFISASYIVLFWEQLKLFDSPHWLKDFEPCMLQCV